MSRSSDRDSSSESWQPGHGQLPQSRVKSIFWAVANGMGSIKSVSIVNKHIFGWKQHYWFNPLAGNCFSTTPTIAVRWKSLVRNTQHESGDAILASLPYFQQ